MKIRRQKVYILITSVLLIIFILIFAFYSFLLFKKMMIGEAEGYVLRKPAPDFTLVDIDGSSFTLSMNRGKIVLLSFFATWCPPCKDQIRHLKELKATFPEGLVIVSITIDPGHDTVDMLKRFRTDYEVGWPILRDTDARDVSIGLYGVLLLPTLFIIDQDGTIRYKHVGVASSSVLASAISLIRESKDIEIKKEPPWILIIVITTLIIIVSLTVLLIILSRRKPEVEIPPPPPPNCSA